MVSGRSCEGLREPSGERVSSGAGRWLISSGAPCRGIRDPKVVLALFTALNLLNYLDRTVLSAVLAPVQGDLHLSNFVAGWLPTIFLIGYFVTSPVFGALGDRAPRGGRTRLIALGIAVWSAATVASGFATGHRIDDRGARLRGRGRGQLRHAGAHAHRRHGARRRRRAGGCRSSTRPRPSARRSGTWSAAPSTTLHGWRAAFFVAGGPGPRRRPAVPAHRRAARGVEALAVRPEDRALPPPPSHTATPRRGRAARRHDRRGAGAPARAPLCGHGARLLRVHVRARRLRVLGPGVPAPRSTSIGAGHASIVFGLVTVAAGSIGTLLGGALADRAARTRVRRAEEAKGGPSRPARAGRRHRARQPRHPCPGGGHRGSALGDRHRRAHRAAGSSARSFLPRSPSSS